MERIAITVTLNGATLQLDQAAFDRLQSWLDDAARALAGNPDRVEIIADLELAVVEQCRRRLPPDRSIVTLAELSPALEEIGAVQAPGTAGTEAPPESPRPLQQVSEGALISGVCLGFARYFQLDVTLLRVIALVLLVASGGTMVLVYAVLMLLLPFAPLQRGGEPVRKIPAKCREFVEFLRGKLSAATS